MVRNQTRIGVVMSYFNMALGSLIPMFYTPIMLGILGQSEYGLVKLASSVTSYLGLISFGIGAAIIRYLTKYRVEGDKEGEEGMFALFNVIFLIISTITLIVGFVITFFLDGIYGKSINDENQMIEMKVLVMILTCTTALSFLSSPYCSVVTAHERFVFLQTINILTTVVTPMVNLISLLMGFKSIGMVTSSLLLTIVIRIVYVIYVRKSIHLKPNYHKMPVFIIKELLVFSFWIFVSNVMSQLYNSTDTLIIGAIPALATVGVAIYNIGVTFSSMMSSFTIGIQSVLSPKVNGFVFSGANNTVLTDLLIRVGRIQCYIVSLVCSGFVVFGIEFINLWAGKGYDEAYWVAISTMIPSCIPLIENVALSVIIAQNKHRFRSLTLLFIAIINVVGTILLVNPLGIVGAALVTGGATVLGQGFIMNWYYWKKIGLEIPRFWKGTAKMFIFPTILCVVSLFVKQYVALDKWIWLLLAILIYTLIFIVFNWLFVMNNYEKDIIRGPIRKIMNKFKKQGAK